MNVKPIRNDEEFDQAVRRASAYFASKPEPGSPDGDTYEMLLMVIEAYQNEHCPFEDPSPIEAIEFRMEQAGLTRKDLIPIIGTIDIVDAVMDGTQELTLPMIRRLHKDLGIPLAILIGEEGHAVTQVT
jgi:HTH-type transcriptional regulator/antitoxin HigA